MNDIERMELAGKSLHQDEEELIRQRRELQEAMQESMPAYFFRLSPPEEMPLWLNLLLIYRMTQSAVVSRAGATVYRVNAMGSGSIIRNLEHLRNEEILDASVYHSFQPFWEGGERIELSKFIVSPGEVASTPGSVEDTGLAIEEVEEIVNTLHGRTVSRDELILRLNHFSAAFLQNASPERLAATVDLYLQVEDSDSLLVSAATFHRRDEPAIGVNRFLLGSSNVPRKGFILKAARVCERMRLMLHRVNVTTVFPPNGGAPAGFSAYYVTDRDGSPLVAGSREYERLITELKTIKWVPDEDRISRLVGTVDEPEKPTAEEAQILRMCSAFLHHLLGGPDSQRFSVEGIEETYLAWPDLTTKLIHIFHRKLGPWRRSLRDYRRLTGELREEISDLSTGVFDEDEQIRRVFSESIRFLESIRKTNFYLERRSAIAVLLDPKVLKTEGLSSEFNPLPQHIYFVFGNDFQGYHFSFSDFVRGGLRTLLPQSRLKYRYYLQGMLRECYDLARTQHLKNKDIPEGGAKGLIVVKPGNDLQVCQRIFVRELSDLLLAEEFPDRVPEVLSAGTPGPHVFLGPDENMRNDMITWIGNYARKRRLYAGSAFMSGHPTLGVNHKRYGVTSRGVHTYLKKCLRYNGIEPDNTEFHVKFSGGPDGDVAGNCMKLLMNEFPDTVKIIAVIDGTGFGHDPRGFDHESLMELVKAEKGIAHFPSEKLHSDGRILHYSNNPEQPSVLVERKGERLLENVLTGNHANRLYSEGWYGVKADVFLPCGGRPNTLNERTWSHYIVGGELSASIIVEGANLFISPPARTELERKGALLIRDSSANKCGVITSSYEVLGLLLLGEKGFEKAMPSFVPELLQVLEERASLEAEWLLERLRESNGTASVVQLSSEFSERMRKKREAIKKELAPVFDKLAEEMTADIDPEAMEQPFRRFACAFRDYIPNAVLEQISANEAWKCLQPAHCKEIIATQIVLRELSGKPVS